MAKNPSLEETPPANKRTLVQDPSSGVSGLGFEESMKRLEQSVAQLERGDAPLETQLKQFEDGVALARQCFEKLEAIERKVEQISQSAQGQWDRSSFQEE